jgi:ankyrin repeat protein
VGSDITAKYSIDINEGDRLGRSVLHFCCMYGLKDLLAMLLSGEATKQSVELMNYD